MTRWIVIGIVAVLALMIFALVDVAMSKDAQVRVLNRPIWIALILLVPAVGAVLWFSLGKNRRGTQNVRPIAPDDDPEFLRDLGKESVDERIRRLEEELRLLDSDAPDSPRAPDTTNAPDVSDASDEPPTDSGTPEGSR